MASLDRYGRTVYSPSQIQAYFNHISLPQKYRDHVVLQNRAAARSAEGLEFLAILQKYNLAAIPFESLALHYSPHHTISLDPLILFHKIVERNAGRGGYCMENSCLFGTLLRSLGYDVYPTGARVNEAVQPISASNDWKGPKYNGWNHMINIVTIAGRKYFVDVGHGSAGAHHPIPLTDGYTAPNVGSQTLRLIREVPPDLLACSDASQTHANRELWTYTYRHTDTSPWLRAFCFSETEFAPADFEMMNNFTSTSSTSMFAKTVLCVKMVMEGERLVGDVTLVGREVKKRIGGKSETLAVFESEDQRVEALEKYLAVKLAAEERAGIRGMPSEII